MRKTILLSLLVTVLATESCKKDSTTTPIINTTVQQSTWKITLLSLNGVDQTSHYTDYQFTYTSSGSVTATKTGSTVTGTWSSGFDDSKEKLILMFSANPFLELNEDWEVVSQSSTFVSLRHISGGGGGTDLLNFTKI